MLESQMQLLDLDEPRADEPVRPVRVGARTLQVRASVFDTYWWFAAERQQVFHHRAAGDPPPWTTDPVIGRHKFTNVYRASDRVSQYLIRDVIYTGPQDVEELVFRILLFKLFNKIETWELLTGAIGEPPSWEGYDFARYNQALTAAMQRGEKVYSAAYIIPNPGFGEARKHGNHLRLLEHVMTSGLAYRLADATTLREVYELLLALPSLGPFLAFQYAIDLGYSPVVDVDENEFVVAGPGCLDGLSKMFADTAGLAPADLVAWIRDVSRDEFDRLGLPFRDLWGRWPHLIDWQNVFCEVSKYTRVSHPHVNGVASRTRIKQEFRQTPGAVDYRFPPKWGLPAERTAQLRQ
ncbi:nucleotide kinase domain-containing protein [Microbispora sp. NPDC088329]|uniref:nucleotide kinase domain-containing protein n=1 Tax=Microbispora sp. NPDC088329 TaxID=3154869 RepID=UPI00342F9153